MKINNEIHEIRKYYVALSEGIKGNTVVAIRNRNVIKGILKSLTLIERQNTGMLKDLIASNESEQKPKRRGRNAKESTEANRSAQPS